MVFWGPVMSFFLFDVHSHCPNLARQGERPQNDIFPPFDFQGTSNFLCFAVNPKI